MDEITKGVFRWTAPHPEWRTRIEWGHQVASYALVCSGRTQPGRSAPAAGRTRPSCAKVQARLDELVAEAAAAGHPGDHPLPHPQQRAALPEVSRPLAGGPLGPSCGRQTLLPIRPRSLTPIVPAGPAAGAPHCLRHRQPAALRDAPVLPGPPRAGLRRRGDLRRRRAARLAGTPFSPSWYGTSCCRRLCRCWIWTWRWSSRRTASRCSADGRAALRRAFGLLPGASAEGDRAGVSRGTKPRTTRAALGPDPDLPVATEYDGVRSIAGHTATDSGRSARHDLATRHDERGADEARGRQPACRHQLRR